MSLRKLYETDKEFKEYVDKFAQCYRHPMTVDQALTTKVISDYAEYLLEKEKEKDNEKTTTN